MKFLESTVQEKNIKAHCVLEEHSHSMVQRTTGAISFRTTWNSQSGHHFFSL